MTTDERSPDSGVDKTEGAGTVGGGDRKNDLHQYWVTNVRYLSVLLVIWAAVSLGAGIVFVDVLNQFSIGGAKLGFWFAQQGSIYTFVGLIVVYIFLMNKLDRQYGVYES